MGEDLIKEEEEFRGELFERFVGRVDEDEVEGSRPCCGLPFGGVASGYLCIQFFTHAFGDDGYVGLDHGGGASIEFDEGTVVGAAAKGFETVGAGAGEEIEDAGVFDPGGGAREDALSQFVHGRTVHCLLVDA